MSKSIANGNSIDLPMDAGKSIKLGWLGGTYSVQIVAGAASVPVALATNSAADSSFGPYANGVMLRVSTSAVGRVEYDVAVTPEFHPPGISYVRQSDGIPVTLSGLGTAAAFAVDGGGSSFTSPPVIIKPLVVGTAAAFTPAVLSDGSTPASTTWATGGVDGTSTLTPALGDYNKPVTVAQSGASASLGLVTSKSLPAYPGCQNFKKSNTAALRSMRAGGVRGRVAVVGDSYPAGYGANNNGYVDMRSHSFPTKLAAALTSAGLAASATFSVGSGVANTSAQSQTAAFFNTLDPRWTFTGCSILANFEAYGGRMIRLATAGDLATFTPGGTFDTVELAFAIAASGQGNFGVSVDGGATLVQTITDSGANGIGRATVTVPGGSTAVTIKKGTAASNIQIVGTRTAASPGIEIYNGGMASGRVLTLATAPTTTADINTWNTRACLPKLLDGTALNLTLIGGCWYNDNTFGRTLAQIQADLATLITECKTYGDVIYINYASLDTASISTVNFRSFSDGCIATALGLDIPVMDTSHVITSYAANTALYYDGLHLQDSGQVYPAGMISAQLLAPIY